jgi:hypothetical protein
MAFFYKIDQVFHQDIGPVAILNFVGNNPAVLAIVWIVVAGRPFIFFCYNLPKHICIESELMHPILVGQKRQLPFTGDGSCVSGLL